MKISAFTILSNPDKYKYPWRESIQSMIPVADEVVVVINAYDDEDYRKELQAMGVRVVRGLFNLRDIGWKSYGIMRTIGYQACHGDVILMFDADGILHESDVVKTRIEVEKFGNRDDIAYGYWKKWRTYSVTDYWLQNKHSGWYNKKLLGDDFDFFHPNGKGIPNWLAIPERWRNHGVELAASLFGYEHVWDTKEILFERIVNYGHMQAKQANIPPKGDQEYIDTYIKDLQQGIDTKGRKRTLEEHPKIIHDKLKSLTENEFGYNYFGLITRKNI